MSGKYVEPRMAEVGELVIYHDSVGRGHNALVTAVYGQTCINAVYVSSNKDEQDSYGRQTKRTASCSHKTVTRAHGNYYRFDYEEPNPIVAPLES